MQPITSANRPQGTPPAPARGTPPPLKSEALRAASAAASGLAIASLR